jgi:hypothetical protein
MKEALVIETGELLDIKFHYFRTGSPTSPPEENKKEKLPYYVLSDGNKYLEKELIVGLDNIREYRIKNIIE